MRQHKLCLGFAAVLFLVSAGSLTAQGVQTASLNGTVVDSEGGLLPGVSVVATSPSLLGERSTVTSEHGTFILRGLPPGKYTVRFSLEGMNTVEVTAEARLGAVTPIDARLELAGVEETIVVTSEKAMALETTTVGANFESPVINSLPAGRTPIAIASLAGGVNDSSTPVAGQIQINGALAYDNAVLVNGVNIQDPIFGTVNNLFIEGAIEETQVLTSGISAEYGQFTGGVVNLVTKSGGNAFSGGLRANFAKPEWRDETPFEKDRNIEREGKTSKFYEATLGGRVVRDRLWFFVAGRDQSADNALTLNVTGDQVPQIEDNERYELKLTGALTPSHQLQASYIDNPLTRSHELQVTPLELAAVAKDSERENDGFVVSYNGVLSDDMFVEARYSEKVFTFVNIGGTSRDIHDSPMRGQGLLPGSSTGTYNHPYFDSTDPEDRNNDQLYGALSYFWAAPKAGTHDFKLGAERFTVTRTGGNSQSASGFVFLTDFKTAGGQPVLDSSGQLIPVFTTSPLDKTAFTRVQQWIPTRGAELDITTDSYFLNDRWALNDHWAFNLGIRHERVKSVATGDLVGVDTTSTVPRIGVSFDPMADGKYKFDATYSEYSGRYNPSIIGTNGPVGNPSLITMQYLGPTGEGTDFAPAFDLNNYVITGVNVPSANVRFEDGLSSPVNEEITLSAAMQLPRAGYLKLTYIDRSLSGVIDDFITIDQGCTQVVLAGRSLCVDNRTYRNTDVPGREYQGLQLQGRYRIFDNWSLEGSWTHQLKNEGTYEGEGGQAIGATVFGDRPEMQSPRNNPSGRFDDFEEDRVRLWTTYALDFGRAGGLDLGMIYRYDSPLTFSYSTAVALSSIQRGRNPGYKQPPSSQTLFFGERGAGEFNSTSLFDFAATYRIQLGPVRPWLKFEVYNLLNDDTLRTYNTQVLADNTSPLDADGLRTGFTRGTNFGKATATGNYVVPREYFFSAGISF